VRVGVVVVEARGIWAGGGGRGGGGAAGQCPKWDVSGEGGSLSAPKRAPSVTTGAPTHCALGG